MNCERIDWNEIQERIAGTKARIEEGFSPSPREKPKDPEGASGGACTGASA